MKQYDFSNIVKAFLDRKLDRAKVVLEVGEMVRSVLAVNQVVEAVLSECGTQDAKPFDVIKTGISYGIALGIYAEKEKRAYEAITGESSFDLAFVIRRYLNDDCPDEYDTEREINSEMRAQKCVYDLVAEVTHEIVSQRANRFLSVKIALLYGISLGIFLERDRAERSKEVLVN